MEGTPEYADLAVEFQKLVALGTGEANGFDLYERELRRAARQDELLDANRDLGVGLVGQVNGLVTAAELNVQEATRASADAVLTGRTLLLIIAAISVGGALLIAWLFVGRVLLRRLQMLSGWMRRMAAGHLEDEVEVSGRDEVAEMAAALEVFRQYALEAIRLNRVEELAAELQAANDQLENALGELHAAQDQIVMREKLAALGELTAGVAHEIRNPLNFVMNFSQLSEELLADLKEDLTDSDGQLTPRQLDGFKEDFQTLTENLERIRHHGDRANRIVQGMLSMSRGSSTAQLTDINQLVDENARLAYHSARATDPDFNLSIQMDLDEDVGELEVVSQDLGRVFLNMVSNACYATDEKRRAIEEEGQPAGYMPTLSLATSRDEINVVVRIKDNGNGIPPEIVEKIFNPFFTTKPTNKGTGLGLAICSDIVRQHGGDIRVETEPGEFTEMIVELPLTPPLSAIAEEAGELEPALGTT